MKKLKSIEVCNNSIKIVFQIVHGNNKSILDQNLVLTKEKDGWKASMDMLEFMPCKTATESAHKLAEWFERMAIEIKKYNYDTIDLNKTTENID